MKQVEEKNESDGVKKNENARKVSSQVRVEVTFAALAVLSNEVCAIGGNWS